MRAPSPRWVAAVAVLALVAAAAVGCKDDKQATEAVDTEASRALWSSLEAASYRTAWAPGPGYEDGPLETVRAHRDTARVYLNAVAAEALAGPALDAWPVGSVLVKDSFEEGSDEVVLVSALEKGEDGWLFVEWDADGAALYAGQPAICTECHGSGHDMVKAFDLSAP